VQTLEGIKGEGTTNYQGFIEVPKGGWVAARAYSANQQADSWPIMHARPFAHSFPIWIKEIGSIYKMARTSAAADIIRAVNVAQVSAKKAYGERPMPKLYKRFKDAKTALELML
jgi:TolB protein